MKMKRMMAAVLAGVMAFSLAACGSSTSTSTATSEASSTAADGDSAVAKIKAAGKVTMVTNAEFPPFEYKDGNEVLGIDADIAKKIADKLGVELEITDIAFDSCIPSLKAGKADFCAAGMTATEDRKKNVDFSDSYFNAGQAIIVPKGSDISKPDDLNDKTIGVQTGTTGDTYVTNEDGSGSIKAKEVKRYQKGMDAVSDLIAGRIDAVVIDNYPAEKFVSQNSDKIEKLDEALTEEEYAIACPKGSDLVEVINEVIKDLKDSGELNEIIDKHTEATAEADSTAEASSTAA
ncbi:MAG: basic amino acid ABC transporter substrate-binding protein [Lachnospiraceae bacterium]|nr:basic amino acid ABC transporter substrate-binding protein [Lachnospiraceae bacterium]